MTWAARLCYGLDCRAVRPSPSLLRPVIVCAVAERWCLHSRPPWQLDVVALPALWPASCRKPTCRPSHGWRRGLISRLVARQVGVGCSGVRCESRRKWEGEGGCFAQKEGGRKRRNGREREGASLRYSVRFADTLTASCILLPESPLRDCLLCAQ